VRIIVYRNGKSTEPVEVVADLAKMEEVCLLSTLACHHLTFILLPCKLTKSVSKKLFSMYFKELSSSF